MDAALFKSFAASVPICLLFAGSVITCARRGSAPSILQVVGAAGIMVVGVAHMCEALHVLPWMGWGEEHSMGHYLDLAGAVLGATLFPLGYLLQAVAKTFQASPGN
jgi:hypothetical protein